MAAAAPMMPTVAEVIDAMNTAALGGDLRRLAWVCEAKLTNYQGSPEGAARLRRGAVVMAWVADLMDAMEHDGVQGL